MCYYTRQTKSPQELQRRFRACLEEGVSFQPGFYNAFQYPEIPLITNKKTNVIQLFTWGLIPSWAKDDSIKKFTLNARLETIQEKPGFRSAINNRCLVLADAFYEWQWLDEKGKHKQRYELTLPGEEAFAFAGLYSEWVDKTTGEMRNTFTILTVQANALMSKIHNSKKRMPVIVAKDHELDWLKGGELVMENDNIIAKEV